MSHVHRTGWFLYQLRQISRIARSAVNTDVLNLEQTQAQYIYIDDPRFKSTPLTHAVDVLDFSPLLHFYAFRHLHVREGRGAEGVRVRKVADFQ